MSSVELKGLQGINLLLENEYISTDVYLKVSVNKLAPCPFQPRKKFDESELNDLAISIKEQGIIQPIICRKVMNNKYEIVAGERRWRAAVMAELQEVPIICRDINDATVLAFALIENIQRKDLNVVDEAHAIKTMIEKFNYTQEEVARILGKGRSTITNLLRILNLNPTVIELVANETIELGHAKLLLSLQPDHQLKIAKKVVEKHLSVRETEKVIQSMNGFVEQPTTHLVFIDERLNDWQERLSNKLHSKVHIRLSSNGKSRVVIDLESAEEIEWLIKKLERI